MFYKCKNCGGNTVYDPDSHRMLCPYCEGLDSEEGTEADVSSAVCPNCGAELVFTDYTSAFQCPSCDTYLIYDERIQGAYEPKMVIPFKVSRNKCKDSLRTAFKKNLFAPSDFLSEVGLSGLKGFYVPYWMYNYKTHYSFRGEGAKRKTWVSGNTEYTEISYYDVRREMDLDFEKVPVDASKQMPDDVMTLVEPYNYSEFTGFDPKYMSGFMGERYNTTSEEEEGRAYQQVKNSADTEIRKSNAGYSSVTTKNSYLNVREKSAQYGLLPVWKYDYAYRDKRYPLYINGQTGKIVGEAPIDKKKALIYTLTAFGIAASVFTLLPLIFSMLVV